MEVCWLFDWVVLQFEGSNELDSSRILFISCTQSMLDQRIVKEREMHYRDKIMMWCWVTVWFASISCMPARQDLNSCGWLGILILGSKVG
jgi:hypothetical protein